MSVQHAARPLSNSKAERAENTVFGVAQSYCVHICHSKMWNPAYSRLKILNKKQFLFVYTVFGHHLQQAMNSHLDWSLLCTAE